LQVTDGCVEVISGNSLAILVGLEASKDASNFWEAVLTIFILDLQFCNSVGEVFNLLKLSTCRSQRLKYLLSRSSEVTIGKIGPDTKDKLRRLAIGFGAVLDTAAAPFWQRDRRRTHSNGYEQLCKFIRVTP
jgi:hypothetical protein